MIHPNRNAYAPQGYDSIVHASDFQTEDVPGGDKGSHYDYQAQAWVDGHDHAHVDAACRMTPLFCGADLATCQGEG